MKRFAFFSRNIISKYLPIIATDHWKSYFVFSILTFTLYSNTLFLSFALDDEIVITRNFFTQQGIKGVPGIFKYDSFMGIKLYHSNGKTVGQFENELPLVAGGRYRPLSLVTFALEVDFFGYENITPNTNNEMRFKGNACISHLINVLLYLFTVCLLFRILFRLFHHLPEIVPQTEHIPINKRWYFSFPFIATLLFLCHPIHTEVVANIKGRDEIMSLLGSLGALWFTIIYIDTNKVCNLVFSGLCLFGGLLSKENAFTFVAVIPITIFYYKNTNNSITSNSYAGSQFFLKAIYPDNAHETRRNKEFCAEAVQLLQRAIQLEPHNSTVHEQLGTLYFEYFNDIAKALYYYTLSLNLQTPISDFITESAKHALNLSVTLLENNKVFSTHEDIIQSCNDRNDLSKAWRQRKRRQIYYLG